MEFLEHLKSYLNDDDLSLLEKALEGKSQKGVLLNPFKISDEEFLEKYPHVKKHPIVKHAYIYDENEYQLGKSLYHELGCFYLQEPSAMVPSYLLNPQKDEIVLDLCAAPGGKSIQASFLMENQGVIIANDISSSRIKAVIENAERLGRGNLLITNNDFSKIYQNYLNYFDKIILDVPCSGSGMFRKEDKMQEDWAINKVYKCQEIQKELILYCYKMLKEGGKMVYSTCSFSKEEDEDVISYLLNNSDAELIPIKENELYFVNKNQPLGIHLLPSIFPGEGHYICLIKKPGILKENKINKDSKMKYPFLSHLNYQDIHKFGDSLFALPFEVKIKNLNINRYGLKLGQFKGQDFIYDIHYARYLNSFENQINISKEEAISYLLGNPIKGNNKKGEYLLLVDNKSLDFSKCDGNIYKNRYPKGLRKKSK